MDDVRPAPKPESTKHLRVLSNGAIYDMTKKRIVGVKPELAVKPTLITSENALAMQSQKQELKRAALRRAANAVASQGGTVDGRELTGDLAFVEAVGEAMTMKALTVNDPKAVDAARFLFTETGIAEAKQEQSPVQQVTDLTNAVTGLLKAFQEHGVQLRDRNTEVIDAE